MTFRSIGDLAIELLRDLELAGSGCSDERAPTPAHPDTRGTELREAGCPEGGNEHPAYARQIGGGGRPSAMRKTGKEPGTREPPAKYEDSVAVKEPTRQPPRVLLRIVSSRSECIAMPQRRSPTVAAMHSHLRLVVDNAHDTAPKALRAFKTARENATSVIPAMKP
jgi:hypothetical protein